MEVSASQNLAVAKKHMHEMIPRTSSYMTVGVVLLVSVRSPYVTPKLMAPVTRTLMGPSVYVKKRRRA